MKYNKGQIASALKAAIGHAQVVNKTTYVYATAFGFLISTGLPPYGQSYYEVKPNTDPKLVERYYAD